MIQRTLFQSKSLIFLAAAMVIMAAWGVSMTGWVKHGLEVLSWVGVGVVLIGLMLARSLLSGMIAHLFSLIIGVAWSFRLTAGLLPSDYTWLERWQELTFRLSRWYNQAVQGGVSHDNLMFILQMSVIVWVMGYLTLWFLFRSGKVWHAIVPCGLVLVINLYYAPKDITFWFLIYVLLSLLLVIRFNLFHQQNKWRTEGVFFQPDISFDFLRDGLIISALIIMLAWMAPPAIADTPEFFEEFEGTWQDIQKNWNRLYADLNYRNTGRVGSFGQSLSLGGPRTLTDAPVMDVNIQGEGRYWRATVYDQYTGIGWRNTDADSDSFGPSYNLPVPIFAAREAVTQTYTYYRDGGTALYAINEPIALDRNAKATFNAVPPKYSVPSEWPTWQGDGFKPEGITYLRSNAAVDQGESYQVVSAVSRATVEQLKNAGTDYPAWITDRYLQLPANITDRTRQLAQQLAAPHDDPFSKAAAIEQYLRSEITYNEKIEAPPPGVEKVDYIVFEVKEAYCDYYASSMIVMLRSLGIPARLAVGFAQGQFDPDRDVYHVINADAHSWVEVYFPTYGWIEFEPTAAQPTITRLLTAEEAGNNPEGSHLNPEDLESSTIPGMQENIPIDDEQLLGNDLPGATFGLPFLGTIHIPGSIVRGSVTGIVIALIVSVLGLAYWWRQQQKRAGQNIFNLYHSMIRFARWMGAALRPWYTPFEHARVIKQRLPEHRNDIDTITNEYVRQTFGQGAPTRRNVVVQTAITYESGLAWRRLRPDMIKDALRRRLPWTKLS